MYCYTKTMIDELAKLAKQIGLELINLGEAHADLMESWSDVLARQPDSITATMSAGFTYKASATPGIQMVTDVMTPPELPAILRTMAINSQVGDDQKNHTYNIQLTFIVNPGQAAQLVSQRNIVTRDNIRQLLQAPDSKISLIAVNNDTDGLASTSEQGEAYYYTIEELTQQPDNAAKVSQALQVVIAKFTGKPFVGQPAAQPGTVTHPTVSQPEIETMQPAVGNAPFTTQPAAQPVTQPTAPPHTQPDDGQMTIQH